MKFLDQAKVYIRSGDGGDGARLLPAREIHRVRRARTAAMAGGAATSGSSAVDGLNTLIDYRYQQHFKAQNGGHGMGRDRTGAGRRRRAEGAGRHADLRGGQRDAARRPRHARRSACSSPRAAMAASATPISSPRPTARRAAPIPAWPGEETRLWLRLKLIADAGLVGLPNAGKSTFLAAVSAAQAEDRRLSLHHAASQPRRGRGATGANSSSPTSPA